jgi:hypothetical protein
MRPRITHLTPVLIFFKILWHSSTHAIVVLPNTTPIAANKRLVVIDIRTANTADSLVLVVFVFNGEEFFRIALLVTGLSFAVSFSGLLAGTSEDLAGYNTIQT